MAATTRTRCSNQLERRQGSGPEARRLSFLLLVPHGRRTADWFIRNVPRDPEALPRSSTSNGTTISACRQKLSPKLVRDKMKVFMEKVERHYGKRPIIYTAPDFYEDNLQGAFHRISLLAARRGTASVKVYPTAAGSSGNIPAPASPTASPGGLTSTRSMAAPRTGTGGSRRTEVCAAKSVGLREAALSPASPEPQCSPWLNLIRRTVHQSQQLPQARTGPSRSPGRWAACHAAKP